MYPVLRVILPDSGATGRLNEVADGEERHESDQVEEEEHGAEGLGMPVVGPLAAQLRHGQLARPLLAQLRG